MNKAMVLWLCHFGYVTLAMSLNLAMSLWLVTLASHFGYVTLACTSVSYLLSKLILNTIVLPALDSQQQT